MDERDAAANGRTGRFPGVPYDWRKPNGARFRARLWNPDEPRLVTPRAWGWGWGLNLYRLLHPRGRSAR